MMAKNIRMKISSMVSEELVGQELPGSPRRGKGMLGREPPLRSPAPAAQPLRPPLPARARLALLRMER